MGALTLFGVPLEAYYPYRDIENYDEEPTAFCYSFARNYQAMSYHRLDPLGTANVTLLKQIKTYLVAGLPPMFGFTVYASYIQSQKNRNNFLPIS